MRIKFSGKILNQLGLVKKVQERFPSLPFRKMQQIINVIIECIREDLVNNQSVSIKNFGTLDRKMLSKRRAVNVSTGNEMIVPEKLIIKLFPHESFSSLIKDRRLEFLKREDEKESS